MKKFAKRNAALWAVIGLNMCVSWIAPKVFIHVFDVELLGAMTLGLVCSQAVLLAVWIALALVPLKVRLPDALAVGIASIYTGLWSAKRAGESIDMFLLVALLLLFLSLLVICSLARLIFRSRIGNPRQVSGGDSLKERQFGLKDLMLWTAGVAVALGVGSWLLDASDFAWYGPSLSELPQVLLMMTGLSLPGLLCVGAVLDAGRSVAWAFSAGSATLILPVLVAIVTGMLRLLDGEAMGFLLAFELSLCGGVIGSLAILAASGWRMERHPAKASSAAGAGQPEVEENV